MDENSDTNITDEMDCLFCQIASKKIPSIIVSETQESLAFLDIKPASEGHIVLIPKTHYQILPQIDDNIIAELFSHAQKLSHAILSGLADKGVNGTSMIINQGQVAGQRASHFMIHIIPQKADSSYLKWDSYKEDENKVYELANLLKEKISNGKDKKTNNNQENTKIAKKEEHEALDLDEISKALGS